MNLPSFALHVISAFTGPGQIAVTVYTLGPGRLGAIIAGVLALTGVVMGALALRRQREGSGTRSGRRGAIAALVTGLIGIALGGLVVATSAGGIGTGNGRGGGIVAMGMGLIAVTLGGLALRRSRGTG